MKKMFCFLIAFCMVFAGVNLALPAFAADEAPSGNALLVKNRYSRSDTHSQDITAQLLANGQGTYYVGNYIKLAEAQANVTYTIVLELFTDAASGNHTWKVATATAVNDTDYVLSSGDLSVTWTGNLTKAVFYGMTKQGSADVLYDYYVDACSLKKKNADNTYGPELLKNPQMEFNSLGVVTDWTPYNTAILEPTTAPPEIIPVYNADGSATYADGVVPATDHNIKYIGRWMQNNQAYDGSWQGYAEVSFTGTTIQLRLSGSCNLTVQLDGTLIPLGSVSGIVDCTPTALESDTHTLRVIAQAQNAFPKLLGFVLDEGASTLPYEAKPVIEFIGDSITEGYISPGVNATVYSYAWQTGELLGMDHNQIAYGGIKMIQGSGTSMLDSYFKRFEPSVADANNTVWDTELFQPDYIVINLGTNDPTGSSAFQPAYTSFLTLLRQAYPDAMLFAMEPFIGKFSAEIQATVAARNAAGDDMVTYIDTTGWATETTDGLHPTMAENTAAAQLLANYIADYLEELSTTPAPSPSATPDPSPTAAPSNAASTSVTPAAEAEETGILSPWWLLCLLPAAGAGILLLQRQKKLHCGK